MTIEKISSLHDDVYVPKATQHLGEYKNYPERFDPSEKSVLNRLEQFGVDISEIEDNTGKKVDKLSWQEYTSIISEAIKTRYDVIVASVFDQYMFPSIENPDEKIRLEKMFKLIKQFEDMNARCGVNLVKRKKDFKENANVVLGLEAGAHLIKSVNDARKLAAKGIKLFGLQYGKDNLLATSNGLTDLGEDVVKDLMNNNLIIDLAHSGYKTRQAVIEIAGNLDKGNLISYTHGCAEEDIIDSWQGKVGERALKKEEFQQIIKNGGIIGLGVTKPFFKNTKKVAERIDTISQTEGGVDNIAIGTDFGGVVPEWLNEIKKPDDFKILADMLADDFKMGEEDINKIIRLNVKNWIRNAID